jgi:hypothetical protein
LSLVSQEAPKVPPNDLRLYSTKRASDDMKELVKQLGEERIVLGGHDWFVGRPAVASRLTF